VIEVFLKDTTAPERGDSPVTGPNPALGLEEKDGAGDGAFPVEEIV
jgi:hypothetical protein